MKNKFMALFLVMLLVSGCSTSGRFFTRRKDVVRIPQMLAQIEPILAENSILVSGKIIFKNPNESDLKLDKITLSFLDEKDKILKSEIMDFKTSQIASGQEVISPVNMRLNLNVLDNDIIKVKVKTIISHKELGLDINVDDVIAIIYFENLKKDLSKPFESYLYSKIYAKKIGNITVDYAFEMINPLGVDLMLENGEILVFSQENQPFNKTQLPVTVLKSGRKTRISGSLDLRSIIGKVIVAEFIKNHPTHIRFTANLRLPDTNISIPLLVETVQEFDFSLFK